MVEKVKKKKVGRKKGEPTKVVRVPLALVDTVKGMIKEHKAQAK